MKLKILKIQRTNNKSSKDFQLSVVRCKDLLSWKINFHKYIYLIKYKYINIFDKIFYSSNRVIYLPIGHPSYSKLKWYKFEKKSYYECKKKLFCQMKGWVFINKYYYKFSNIIFLDQDDNKKYVVTKNFLYVYMLYPSKPYWQIIINIANKFFWKCLQFPKFYQ